MDTKTKLSKPDAKDASDNKHTVIQQVLHAVMKKHMKKMTPTPSTTGITVTITPWTPTADYPTASLADARVMMVNHPDFKERFGKSRVRVLGMNYINPQEYTKRKIRTPTTHPEYFRAEVYDYTNARSYQVEGHTQDPDMLQFKHVNASMCAHPDEFKDAVSLLKSGKRCCKYGADISSGGYNAYRAMPSISIVRKGARQERVVHVSLRATGKSKKKLRNMIVGVNMCNPALVEYKGGFPPESFGTQLECTLPAGNQGTPTTRDTEGAAFITIKNNGATCWRFHAIRPAAAFYVDRESCGIELRNVWYSTSKGTFKIIHNGSIPVVNVTYKDNICGPYLDRQYQEVYYVSKASPQNPNPTVPGFRLSSSYSTIVTSNVDGPPPQAPLIRTHIEELPSTLIKRLKKSF